MKFRWHGAEYAAEFVRRLESGAVIAKAVGHGPRFAPGSEIEVQPNEIVSLDDEKQAGMFTGKPSDLRAAMNDMPIVPPADVPVAIPAMAITPDGLVAADPRTGFAVLQKAMDAERETLPSVAEVIADPNPTPPLSDQSPAAAQPSEAPMTDTNVFSRLQEKAKLAAGAAGEVAAAVEATFDDILAKKAALLERNNTVHAQHRKVIDDANAGLDTIESALRQMSNGGPA